jgi:hypothetical protein
VLFSYIMVIESLYMNPKLREKPGWLEGLC